MYDIIGDIHGHAEELKTLLQKMGYECVNGTWQHTERKVIYLGDYIDRGPAIRETLEIVHSMVTGGKAFAIMGNHEYNALAYAYQKADGQFLRAHNEKNLRQHKATLQQFEFFQKEWNHYLEWFYTLPLFLELDGIRIVHACWDDEHMDWLNTNYSINGTVRLSHELLVKAHDRNSKEYEVIEDILKGKEVDIPAQFAWRDKDNNWRTKNRVKWWVDPKGKVAGDFLFNCPEEMQDQPQPGELHVKVYPADAPPVFFGHYWLTEEQPSLLADNIICLDYSVAKNGALVAYRWNPEEKINAKNFVLVRTKEGEI